MRLRRVPGSYAICRLPADAPSPALPDGVFSAVVRTAAELSIVCAADAAPTAAQVERDWALLEVEGPLDLSMVGVLAALTEPLAQAGVNLFAVSTFDTDYLLVPEPKLQTAAAALAAAGHDVGG